MKGILILCSALAIANAGVGVLSPQDEQSALQLFHQVCAQAGSDGAGADMGGFTVYCKSARDDFQETLTHQVHVPASAQRQAQVVFVQPPSVRYQHNVLLTGSPGQGQQSKIYVLPQRATHQIAAQYNPGQSATVKPVVYFLNSSPGQQQSQQPQYGVPAPAQQRPEYGSPAQQRPEYGAPAQQQPQYGVPVPAQQRPEYGAPAPVQQRPEYGVPAPVQQRPEYGAPAQQRPEYGAPAPTPSIQEQPQYGPPVITVVPAPQQVQGYRYATPGAGGYA